MTRILPTRYMLRAAMLLLGAVVLRSPDALAVTPHVNYPPIAVVDDGEPSYVALSLTGSGFGTATGSSYIFPFGAQLIPSTCDCANPTAVSPPFECTASHCIVEWSDSFISARVNASVGASPRSVVFTSGGSSDLFTADSYRFDRYDAVQQGGGCGPIAVGVDSSGRAYLNCEFNADWKQLNPAIGRVSAMSAALPAQPIFSTSACGGGVVNFVQSGEDIYVDPYDRVWFQQTGKFEVEQAPGEPNHSRIVMYDRATSTTKVYSVPSNDNEVYGMRYQSGIACVSNRCQDETLAFGGGRPCSQSRDCDRVWYTEKGLSHFGLPAETNARLAWFDPALTPSSNGTYDYATPPPAPACIARTCGDNSGRSCDADDDCPALCGSGGLCGDGITTCTDDADCDVCHFTTFIGGSCADGSERGCNFGPCSQPRHTTCFTTSTTVPPPDPNLCCRAVCGAGHCANWPDQPCFTEQDCARGSPPGVPAGAATGAKACAWNAWAPGSDCYYHEYELPDSVSIPAFSVVASDGGVWFTSYFNDNRIGRLDRVSGDVRMFPLPPFTPPGIVFNPWDIQQVPPDLGETRGDIIVTEFQSGAISRFNLDRIYEANPPDCENLSGNPPQNPCITQLQLPGYPEGVAGAMTVDPLGRLWFSGGTLSGSTVGYLKPGTTEHVIFPSIGSFPSNLARGAIIRSGSAAFPLRDGTFAVDGITDGVYANRSVAITLNGVQPFFEIDLHTAQSVDKVRLWNQTDPPSTMQDFWVMGSDHAIGDALSSWLTGATWKVYQGPAMGTSLTVQAPGGPSAPSKVRYVRVQRASTSQTAIALAEIQALAAPTIAGTASVAVAATGDVWAAHGRAPVTFGNTNSALFGRWAPLARNLAANRPATMSPYYFANYGPGKAVDSNPDGEHAHQSIAVTAPTAQPWWQVDLGSVNAIGQVDAWNCSGACGDAQTDFYVLVSDVPFTSNVLATLLADPSVSNYHVTGHMGRPSSVTIGRTGRYVRVQLAGTAALSLAEVVVLGNASGMCTAATQATDCNDNNNCTADICHRGRCEHECRIGSNQLTSLPNTFCPGSQTCQVNQGTCGCM